MKRISIRQHLRRGLCLLLGVVLLSGGPAAGAEEQEEENDWDRFGINTEVERDPEGTVVSVNGYPVRSVRAAFNDIGSTKPLEYETDFMEYPFWRPATAYDGNLAVMSLVMALCANRAQGYNNIQEEGYDPSRNVVAFLEDAGFTEIRRDDYSRVPTMFTVSTAIGSRRMEAEGQEPFTLVAVAVCGAGYRNEWLSNLTPGEGTLHEGFLSAANLVVDRLSGYLVTHGIRGKVKVWISGFSRAAAVSNLAAGLLDRAGAFAKEDLYAYTFATPAAVHHPPEEGYENIWNLVDPMDPVPQFMPGTWGYGRYGTTLYIPVEEFSGLEGSILQGARDAVNAQKYGTENNYSPLLNLRVRLMLGFLMGMVDSRETYNREFRPALTRIIQDKNLMNVLNALHQLLSGLGSGSRRNRAGLDALMDYIIRLVMDLAGRRDLGAADRNAGSLFLRMMDEHTENTYLGNAPSIRDGRFSTEERFFYAFVKGPVTLKVQDSLDGTSGEGDTVTLEEDGSLRMEGLWSVINPEGSRAVLPVHMARLGNVAVAMIPENYAGRVTWTAVKDGTAECRLISVGRLAEASLEVFTGDPEKVRAGDSGTLWQGGADSLSRTGLVPGTASPGSVTDFLEITSPGVSWRTALTVLLCALGVLLGIPLCLAASRRRKKRGLRTPRAVWPLLCAYGAAVLNSEAAFWVFADQPARLWGWMILAAACLAAVVFLMGKKGTTAGPGDGSRRRVRILLCLLAGIVLRLVFELTKEPLPHLGFALALGLAALLCAAAAASRLSRIPGTPASVDKNPEMG